MQIELPQHLLERIQQRALAVKGESEADVIRRALDLLDWQEGKATAIQEGLDDLNKGDVMPYDQFAKEFMAKNKIVQDS